MSNDVYTLFCNLKSKPFSDELYYLAEPIPFSKRNKIGLSKNGYPVFFIESCSDAIVADVRLELIVAQFNQQCVLEEKGKSIEGVYDIILLKTENDDLQKYFIDVFCLILKKLPSNADPDQVKKEIDKFIQLFRTISDSPKKDIQGLWAEMFVLYKCENLDYLLNAWHVHPSDKYDFNDGIDKLEVKSTCKMRRVHHFSLEQLAPNKNSKLIVASVIVIETGSGMNLIELRRQIAKKIVEKQFLVKLDEVIIQTLGSSINSISEVFFDLKQAEDSLRFFDSNDIPTIPCTAVPSCVSDVKFSVDLSGIKPLKASSSLCQRKLFNGLFK